MAGPGSDITRRVEIGIMREATPAATEARPIPERLNRAAFRTSERGVRRSDQRYLNPYQSRKQYNPFCKIPGCPLPQPWQAFRVLKRYASASSQCHGHQLSGFAGKRLSLRSLTAKVMRHPLPLAFSRFFFLFSQDGAEVWPTVAIATSNTGPHAYVVAVPTLGLVRLRQRTADVDDSVPLPFAAHDLRRFAQYRAGMLQRTVQRTVFFGRKVELAVTAEPLDMYPQVKLGGLAGFLHFGGVTQLSVQVGKLELLLESLSSLLGPSVVVGGPVAHPLLELPLASLALPLEDKLALLSNDAVKEVKGLVLLPGEVGTEHPQHVGLHPRDIELDSVGQGQGFFFGSFHRGEWQWRFGHIRGEGTLGIQVCPHRLQLRRGISIRAIIRYTQRQVNHPTPCEATGSRYNAIITLGTHDATPSLGSLTCVRSEVKLGQYQAPHRCGLCGTLAIWLSDAVFVGCIKVRQGQSENNN